MGCFMNVWHLSPLQSITSNRIYKDNVKKAIISAKAVPIARCYEQSTYQDSLSSGWPSIPKYNADLVEYKTGTQSPKTWISWNRKIVPFTLDTGINAYEGDQALAHYLCIINGLWAWDLLFQTLLTMGKVGTYIYPLLMYVESIQ